MCATRLQLLRYLTLLKAYDKARPSYSADEFREFRDKEPHIAALRYAELSDIGTLCSLWKSLKQELSPWHLEILQAIPETVSPSEYQSILPAKAHDDGAAVGIEKKDAVEDPSILAMLGGVGVRYAAPEPTTQLGPEEMTAWYLQRARQIDAAAGAMMALECCP